MKGLNFNMKIGVITFTYGQNYGNKLQNYALVEFISKKYCNEVYTLQNFDKTTKGNFVDWLKKYIKKLIRYDDEKIIKNRKLKFESFNKKYLRYYDVILNKSNYNKFNDFDVLICGSDQIWNPFYNKDMITYTAAFAKNVKRVSYAASIGINQIPENLVENYKKNIGTMDYIGVREMEGAELLRKYINKEISVQVDPTMLLTVNEWNEIVSKPNKKVEEEFILTYFIKEMDIRAQKEIEAYSKKTKTKIINLNSLNEKSWYDLDPCEFLWMIKNAKFVFSDSFHATVFSLIFHKPFHCFERINKEENNKQESRLNTLLNYFNLNDKIGDFKAEKEKNVDWENIDKIMENIKQKSIYYLEKEIKN